MTTRSFTFHIQEAIHDLLRQLAETNERTVSGELRIAIRNHLINTHDCAELHDVEAGGFRQCGSPVTHATYDGFRCAKCAKFYPDALAL